ncbi:MAG: type I-E CRISPR-associated protein Cas5/CasD [Gallicola sp.]|nr:type I-E CRISPR-associated protein Cas5/CasD [Gallicola sp.]
MSTILLKFSGPLQSWGTSSRFEYRYTDRYPSKSAVIGFLAASLGLRREEDEEITKLNELDFAIRIDQEGTLLRDFHTAYSNFNKNKKELTYVTHRYYLQDAVFVIGIGSSDESLILRIKESLNYPYFPLYLGRRSLPVNPDFFMGIEEKGVIESLNTTPWQAAEWYKRKINSKKEAIDLDVYADGDLLEIRKNTLTRDRVISFSQKERKYGFRSVSKTSITFSLEHDALKAIGG